MEEKKVLKFKGVLNKLSKSEKGLMLLFDGAPNTLKSKMLDKLIDNIEPSRYRLVKYSKRKFDIKRFWQESCKKGEIVIFDGSYKQNLSSVGNEYKNEVAFFEQQMEKYGFHIMSYKFKNARDFKSEVVDGQIKIYGNVNYKNDAFEFIIENLTEEIKKMLNTPTEVITPVDSIGISEDLDSIKNPIEYFESTWKDKQNRYKNRIRKLHEKMIDTGKSMVIVFQGIDGAGKSSAIRRLISKMCPHWYSVYGIQAPTKEELAHHHLWRFWTKLPKNGEIVIFDRSWYERLTAERVLKLNNNGWVYGVDEIAEFERELEENGIKVVKFWINISKDTQKARFDERENNPLKQWKISASDYKTREKWDEYQVAFKEMLANTGKWFLIDGTNKREARLNIMKYLIDEMKKII